MTSYINIVKELPNQISEKADKKQIELKKVINNFIKIGKEIQKLTDLLTNLYNLGIIGTKIDENFHEYIRELIQSKPAQKTKQSKALQLSDKGVLTIPFKECDFEASLMHIEIKYHDWLNTYQEGLTIGHDAYMLSFFAKTSLYNLLKSIIKGEPEEVTMSMLRESKSFQGTGFGKEAGRIDFSLEGSKIRRQDRHFRRRFTTCNRLLQGT
jgi:hypothetical protein